MTLTCECGATQRVKHGERWTCPDCGRLYDTSRIPRSSYLESTRVVSRYRLITLGPLLVLAAVMVPLVVLVDPGLVFVMGVLAFGYILLFLPWVRRHARRDVAEGTAWDLPAE